MMNGTFYIDGIDAFAIYGVFVAWEGYKGIISRPQFKTIDTNDWPEIDGIETDLINPVLNTREFTINFGCVDTFVASDFIFRLSDKSYHIFEFPELNYEVKLRLVSQPSKEVFLNLESFSLQFADDFPFDNYDYEKPDNIGVSQLGYELDDIPFSDFGVWILEGSDDDIEKSPAVKKNLLVNVNNRKGAVYDGEKVVFQSKDVPLKCGMKAPDIETFWKNYNSLFYCLIRPGERQFFSEKLGEPCACFYKSLECTRFDIIGEIIWIEFTLTLVFTSFRVSESMYLLATEDDRLSVTEDGDYFINVKNYGAEKN